MKKHMKRDITRERGRSGQRRVRQRLSILLAVLCGLVLPLLRSPGSVARADGLPGGDIQNPVVRAVDIARPAVVRVVTQINGRLTVHFSRTQNVTFPLNGSGYGLAALGTGTFISAHGDILTADHVINPPRDNELNSVLIQAAAPDVAAYYDQTIRPGAQISADQMQQELLNGQIPSDPAYDQPQSAVYLSTDYSGPLSAARLSEVPPQYFASVDRIEKASPVNQADVAIIHVNMNDMPSVQLGNSSSVQVQDSLTIIGFPGNADVSMRPTDFLTSSVNRIFVSSMKTTDSGAQVIQVGGNVEQGDSGGPALDSQGHVVGIVSFGTPGGTSFLQASNSARSLIQALNLDTAPGPFQQAWAQAFNDYASTGPGHWHRAAQEFSAIATRYPAFKAITPYLTYARQQAAHESSPSNQMQPVRSSVVTTLLPWAAAGAGAAVVLVLVLGGLIIVVVRRRRARSRSLQQGQSPSDLLQTQPAQQMQHQPVGPAQGLYASPVAPGVLPQSSPPPASPPAQVSPSPFVPRGPQAPQPGAVPDQALSAFGGPPRSGVGGGPAAAMRPGAAMPQVPGGPPTSVSGTLRPWPCGHMNRPNARFCSICGEPAPPPPTVRRIVEQ